MRRTELVEKRDILLFDILEELKAIRADLRQSNIADDNLPAKEEKSETEPISEAKLSEIVFDDCVVVGLIEELKSEIEKDEREGKKPLLPCKHCGEFHAKPIDIVNCGRRKNKKG